MRAVRTQLSTILIRTAFGILALTGVVSTNGFGHPGLVHEIFFPKVFAPSELPNTGFVFVNLSSSIATVNFYYLSMTGVGLSTSAEAVGPGEQLARLGNELFPNAAADGWVYAITDTDLMHAFWLTYDSGITFLDGAQADQYDTIGPDQIIPLVTAETELSLISLQNSTRSEVVTVRLFGPDDELAPPFMRKLPAASAYRARVSEMFPAADMTQARYVRIGAPDGAVASTAMIKGFQVPTEVAVANGINAATGPEITFPHVVTGAFTGAAYTTTIGVTNLADVSQTLTISFNPGEGTPMVARRVLAAHAAVRETAQSLFGLSDEFRTGWVRVTGSAPITGFASYADTVRGGLAIVPPTAPDTSFFFLHIADGPPQWQTGLALLNTSSTSATVEIDAMSQSGSLIGTTTMTMEPGKKIANVIHELISETRGVNGGFICVRSTNDVPLYGMELFYTQDLRVLSNVAAGRLAKGTSCGPRQ